MRVFARTAHHLRVVKAATPLLHRDYTLAAALLRLDLAANLLNDKGILSGSVPVRIRVVDPLGAIRYDLHRATDRGVCKLSLPLAINDPAGKWTVQITELLNNSQDSVTFLMPALSTCNSAAGATRRAVHLPEERDRVFRFFRTHQNVTIVKGAGDHNAAADRLVSSLKPWNVKCSLVSAAEANKPRPIAEDEAPTYIGLEYTGRGSIKPGDKNNPAMVGFAVRGPVILLGTPEDNPLIKFLLDAKFLPYTPSKTDLPGPGRGLVAWQRDAIGANQESIALIGYDAAGIGEAIGTMYEMLAGMEPLTPLTLPRRGTVVPAKNSSVVPELVLAWSDVLSDRIVGLKAAGDKLSVLTYAGTLAEYQKDGKVKGQRVLDGADAQKAAEELKTAAPPAQLAAMQKKVGPTRLVKFVAPAGKETAVAYWGGTVEVFDSAEHVKAVRRLPQDVTALLWSGSQLIVGDADGRLVALTVK